MTSTTRRLGVGLLTLALVAAGCGSSAKKSSSGDPSTTAAAAKPTGTPIRLGLMTSITGPGVHFPEIPRAAQAAADAINAAGGVKDAGGGPAHPIEIDVCDSGFDPAASAGCARKMVSDKVLAMVGNVSPDGDVYAPIVFAAGIPLVGIQANSAAEVTNELSFPIQGGSVVTLISEVAFMAKQGVKKLTLEHIQTSSADFLVAAMKKKATELGVTVVNDVPVPPDAVDMTSYAARFTSNGAEGALMVDPSDRISKYVTALTQAGTSLEKFKMVGQLNPSDLKKLGAAADGFIGADTAFPIDDTSNAGIKRFVTEYAKEKNAPDASTFGLQAWVAVHVLAENVIPKMTTVDSAALVAAMKTGGLIARPEWTPFDWAKPVEAIPGLKLRSFSLKLVFSKVQNSRFTPITSEFTQYL